MEITVIEGENMFKFPEGDTFFSTRKNVLDWGAKDFAMLQPHLKDNRVCLDVGAHCGITTLRYATHFANVHSFEPIHHVLLSENTKSFPNVTVHGCAISDKAGTVEMYPNIKNSGGGIIPDEYNAKIIGHRYENKDAMFPEIKKIIVECLPLDSFNFIKVDLIKIDVEMHILPVINGMIDTLTNNSPIVQIEMSDYDDVNTRAHTIFQELGYVEFGFDFGFSPGTYNYNHQDSFYYKNN